MSVENLHWQVSYYSEEDRYRLEKKMRECIISDGAKLDMMTIPSIQKIES